MSEDITITFTPDAMKVIHNCYRLIDRIGLEEGEHSDAYRKAMNSWIRSMDYLLSNGGRVMKDGEYSLLSWGRLEMGLIFHPVHVKLEDENGESHYIQTSYGEWSTHT